MEKYSLSYGTNEYGSCFHCSTWALLGRRIRELNVVIRPMERRELNSNNRKYILSLLHMPSLLRLRLYLNNTEKGIIYLTTENTYLRSAYMSQLRLLWFAPHNSMKKCTIGRKINNNRKYTPPLLCMPPFCVLLCTSSPPLRLLSLAPHNS